MAEATDFQARELSGPEDATLGPPSELLEAARALTPLISEQATASEAQGSLTDEVVDALHGGGLWAMWTPESLGGAELGPVESLRVIEQLSYADASTGWVVMAAGLATGTGGAYLGDAAVEQLFAGERSPIIEGVGTPTGKAVAQDGGYVLSGRWSYGSGVLHCDYIHTGAMVHEANGEPRLQADGTPESRVFVLPRADVAFGGNWDVLGLRATGSIDYTIESVFVPEAYTHVSSTETPLRGGAVYTIGIPGFGCIAHSGWALGVGRRILDELLALVHERIARPGAVAESPLFQANLATAEAKYRAARAFLFETWGDIETTLRAGKRASTRQKTLARLALNHATWTISDVSMFAYATGGGYSLRESTIQRYFRDMHAGTQHFTSGQPVLTECGRELAGIVPGKEWRFFELVDPV